MMMNNYILALDSKVAPQIHFLATQKRMALIRMNSVAEAVVALVRNHNLKVSMCFSFIKIIYSIVTSGG
jgi:hypothetical protein